MASAAEAPTGARPAASSELSRSYRSMPLQAIENSCILDADPGTLTSIKYAGRTHGPLWALGNRPAHLQLPTQIRGLLIQINLHQPDRSHDAPSSNLDDCDRRSRDARSCPHTGPADVAWPRSFACSRPGKTNAKRFAAGAASGQFKCLGTGSAFKRRGSETPYTGADGTWYRLGSPQTRPRLENISESRRAVT